MKLTVIGMARSEDASSRRSHRGNRSPRPSVWRGNLALWLASEGALSGI